MPYPTLQIEDDLAYQRRSWIAQRIGWTVMLLVILAAAAGLFGDGILSKAAVENSQELRVEYDGFLRYMRPASLTIHTRADSAGAVRIGINGEFFRGIKLDNVVPQPMSVEAGHNWLRYHFAVHAPGALVIRIDFVPEQVGPLTARISAGNEELSFRQFVYP